MNKIKWIFHLSYMCFFGKPILILFFSVFLIILLTFWLVYKEIKKGDINEK